MPLAALASLVVVSGTVIDGRVLLVPMLGSSALLAALWTARANARTGWRHWGTRVGVGLVVALHLGFSPLLRVAFALNFARIAQAQESMVERSKMTCATNARLLLVNGSDPAVGMYAGAVFAEAARQAGPKAMRRHLARPGWHVLTMASNDLELRALDAHRFELRTLGERKTHMLEQLYRPPDSPLQPGDEVELHQMKVQVLQTSEAGVTHARFTVREELHGPRNYFVKWQGGPDGHLESFKLPSQGSLQLAHQPGPMQM